MLYLIIFIIAGSVALTGLSIAPWFPARRDSLETINKLSALKPGQTFIDLGCGDGRVCYYIAKKNPQAKVIGIELFFLMYLISKIKNYFYKLDNIKIIYGNAFKLDFADYDVIYVYGIRNSVNNKLKSKFEKELKKGAKVISYTFSIRDWKGRCELEHSVKMAPLWVYEKGDL